MFDPSGPGPSAAPSTRDLAPVRRSARYAMRGRIVFTARSTVLGVVLVLVGLSAVALAPTAVAQDAPGQSAAAARRALTFGGTSRIEAEASTVQRFGQGTPPSFLRWTLTPTVDVYGIPFGVDLLFTTEDRRLDTDASRLAGSFNLGTQQLSALVRERLRVRLERLVSAQAEALLGDTLLAGADTLRARLDSLRMRVDDVRARIDGARAEVDARRAQIERLTRLAQRLDGLARSGDLSGALGELRQTGLLSRAERRALRFPSLGLGVVTPQYSPYTLAGVPALGATVEIAPGLPFLSLAAGRVRDPISGDVVYLDPSLGRPLGRTLVAARAGLGRPSGSHLLATGMLARDDRAVPDTLLGRVTPERSVVAGLAAGLGAFGGRLRVRGEASGALFTRDVDAPAIDSTLDVDLPGIVGLLGGATIASSVDAAGEGRVEWRSASTDLSVGGLYIGPGYVSLGAPGLRPDRLAFDGRIEQQFFDRQMSVGALLEQERDNLGDTKSATSDALRTGLSLGVTRRGGPYARLNVRRDVRRTESDASALSYTSSLVSAQAGHTLRRGRVLASTTVVGVYNGLSGPGIDYTTTTLTVAETIGLGLHALTLSYGFSGRRGAYGEGNQHRVDARASTVVRRVRLGLGGTLDRSGDLGGLTGLDLSVGAALGPFGDLDLRVEQSWISKGLYAPEAFQQARASLVLTRSF